MPVDKVCQQCGKDFQTPKRRSELVKYCSIPCRSAAHRELHKCNCCGTEFSRKKSDNPDAARKYCSKVCDMASRKGRKHAVDPNAPQYFRECELCKTTFKVNAQRKDTARFCSVVCKSKSYSGGSDALNKVKTKAAPDPRLSKNGYPLIKLECGRVVYEHRHVMEQEIIRHDDMHPFLNSGSVKSLRSEIEVHHIDRDKTNNNPSNLLAVTMYAHSQIHHRNRKPNPWECWPPNPERW